MSAVSNIQGVQFVPGLSDYFVHWSSDVKLYKLSIEARNHSFNSNFVKEYMLNCPALRTGTFQSFSERNTEKINLNNFFRTHFTHS